ncbi:MAG TPA: XdhC family protein [Streptosporangiaceae bacterium]|jgi:xanthine/CO dehydrogenase XdhC/CoxF family maturation factor
MTSPMTSPAEDPACSAAHGHDAAADPAGAAVRGHSEAPDADAIAHGTAPAPAADPAADKVLVAIFASPVARFLLRYAADVGYRALLLEPDPDRARDAKAAGFDLAGRLDDFPAGTADVVMTDHHRPELGVLLRDALASDARWIGLMGNARHVGPHVAALTELGVPAGQIARVHRPIGLSIGSRTPPEIAISTIAGLIAERNGRPGGFEF